MYLNTFLIIIQVTKLLCILMCKYEKKKNLDLFLKNTYTS